MIPVQASRSKRQIPIVTWTLTVLLILLYLWDRQWHLTGQAIVFSDLALRPSEVVGAVRGSDHFALVTLFTSMFLHGSLVHIGGNLIFLLVFGPPVEAVFGSARYSIYYLVFGVVAALAQIFVDPASVIPVIGASGAISGILGAYLVLFPSSKITVYMLIIDFDVPAWIFLGLWFLYQIFAHQQGVANWEHAGGFLAGMLAVLLKGGKGRLLKGREQEFEPAG